MGWCLRRARKNHPGHRVVCAMSRVFLCGHCQAQINRFAAAPLPGTCPYCRSDNISELDPLGPSLAVAPSTAFACERGEICARLVGGECPGGKGC